MFNSFKVGHNSNEDGIGLLKFLFCEPFVLEKVKQSGFEVALLGFDKFEGISTFQIEVHFVQGEFILQMK